MTFLKYGLVGLALALPLFGAHTLPQVQPSVASAVASEAKPQPANTQKKGFFTRLKQKANAFWSTLKRKILETQDELIRLLIIAIIVALIVSIVVWLLPWPLDVLIMVIALVVLLIFLLRYLS